MGTTLTMRDTLGWGGRKSSPVILVTSVRRRTALPYPARTARTDRRPSRGSGTGRTATRPTPAPAAHTPAKQATPADTSGMILHARGEVDPVNRANSDDGFCGMKSNAKNAYAKNGRPVVVPVTPWPLGIFEGELISEMTR
jgi:hypothetical protein